MNAVEVKPRKFKFEDASIEATELGVCIAGYVNSVRMARELFTSPLQAGILADTLANLADIWFGDLITVKEKEA